MELITQNEYGKIEIANEVLHIKVFKSIWDRDKTRTKKNAIRELGYVWWTRSYKSPYFVQGLDDTEKLEQYKIDAELPKDWKPDDLIKAAQDKFKDLTFTQSLYLIEDAQVAINKLRSYFRNIDLEAVDKNGKLKHSSATLMRNLKEIGEVNIQMKKLREEAMKEIQQSNRIKGGDEKGLFEDPPIETKN